MKPLDRVDNWILAALALAAAPVLFAAESTSPAPGVPWSAPAAAATDKLAPTRKPAEVPERWKTGATVLTLSEVIDIALRNNPATRAAWYQARSAADELSARKGAYLPELDFAYGVTRQKQAAVGGQFVFLQTTYGPSAVVGGPPGTGSSATVNYTLLDSGKRSGEVDEARRALFAANWSHNSAIQNLILQVESAYFQYQNAKALLSADQATLTEAQQNLEAANERHRAGVATIADVLQAKTAVSQARLEVDTVEGAILALRGALVTAVGFPASLATLPIDVEDLPTNLDTSGIAHDADGLIAEAEQKRPDLAAARQTALAAAAHVRAVRSDGLPTLGLNATANRTYYAHPAGSHFSTNYAGTIQLKFPVFNGFQNLNNTRKARDDARASAASAEGLEQQVILQVWTSYANLKTAAQRLATAHDLLDSAKQSEDVAAGRYRNGVGNIIDLLNAQSTLASARAQEVQARSDWLQSLAQLAHDTGVLAPPAAGTADNKGKE
jgi:outer membrane protein TolC